MWMQGKQIFPGGISRCPMRNLQTEDERAQMDGPYASTVGYLMYAMTGIETKELERKKNLSDGRKEMETKKWKWKQPYASSWHVEYCSMDIRKYNKKSLGGV